MILSLCHILFSFLSGSFGGKIKRPPGAAERVWMATL